MRFRETREESGDASNGRGVDPQTDDQVLAGHVLELIDEAVGLTRQLRLDEADALLVEARQTFSRIKTKGPYETTVLMLAQAQVLSARGEWTRALRRVDLSIEIYGAYPQLPAIPPSILQLRAILLERLGQHDAAYVAVQAAIDATAPEADEGHQRILSELLVLQGSLLQERSDYEGATVAYQGALQRISPGRPEAFWTTEVTWRAMFGLASSLEQRKRAREALTAYDELICRFTESTDPDIQAAVVHARSRRAALSASSQ